MGICWYCYWGWSKPVADIFIRAIEKLNGDSYPLLFGPSHIVWEDENFDSAQSCLDDFDEYAEKLTAKEKEIVRWSLEELNKLPKEVRCVEPEDYDYQNPDKYPPPKGIEMVRVQANG